MELGWSSFFHYKKPDRGQSKIGPPMITGPFGQNYIISKEEDLVVGTRIA
jgi:hypothetical protein